MNITFGKILLCAVLVLQSLAYAAPMDCADMEVSQLPCHEQGPAAPQPPSGDCDHCQDCRAPAPIAPLAVPATSAHTHVINAILAAPIARPAPIDDIYHPPNSLNA